MVRRLLSIALCAALWLATTCQAQRTASSSGRSSLSLSSSLAQQLPGLLSRQLRQDLVDKELRRMILNWNADAQAQAQASNTKNNNNNSTTRLPLTVPVPKGQSPPEVEVDDGYIIAPDTPLVNGRRLNNQHQSDAAWYKVNEILESFEFNIPNFTIDEPLLGFDLFVQVNGTCSGIQVGDVLLDWDKGMGEETLAYKLQVLRATLRCYLYVDWNTGVLEISDTLKVKVVLNDINFGVAINLIGAPPKQSEFLACKFAFSLGDVASTGGFSSNIINDLNYAVIDLVTSEADAFSTLACDTITDLTDTLDEALVSLGDLLEPYINISPGDVDPLYLEKDPPTNETLVNFQDTEGFGNLVNVILRNLEDVLSADQINTLVDGSGLVDDDGVLVIEIEDPPVLVDKQQNRFLQDNAQQEETTTSTIDSTCFEEAFPIGRRLRQVVNDYVGRRLQLPEEIDLGEIIDLENVLEINEITPIKISVVGLNNFTDGRPLTVIGEQTLNTELELARLYIEAELFVDVDINNVTVQNLITVGVEIKDIFINASYFIGLSEDVVNTWTIGTFLVSDNFIPCIYTALAAAGVTQLDVTVGYIGTPFIIDFVSPGVTDLSNTAAEAIVCVYQDLILESIPGFVQSNATTYVNDFVDCTIEEEKQTAVCEEGSLADALLGDTTPAPSSDIDFDFKKKLARAASTEGNKKEEEGDGFVPGYLDFRDLLLPPEEALALGGRGNQPYGDVIGIAYKQLKDMLTSISNETGLPEINSNVPEDLEFDLGLDQFFDTSGTSFVNTLLQSVALGVYNVRLQNLNTMVNPLNFLEPTRKAHVLSNLFNFGPLPVPVRSLDATFTVFMELNGTDSPLAMSNEVDASGRVSELDILADFQVMISALDFIRFPLKDILNMHCWLALIKEPNQISNGEMIDNSFEIKKLLLDILKMSVEFQCLNCTSNELPGAIECLDGAGAMAVLGNRVGPLLEEIATSDMFPPMITNLLGLGDEAARKCPHSSLYNTTSNDTSSFSLEMPVLSSKSVDTVVYAGILGAEVFGVVFADSHLTNSVGLSDPLSTQEAFNMTDVDLLDWLRLNESFIPFAGDALDLVREFLGGTSDGGDLGVNEVLADFLNDEGKFNMSFDILLDLVEGYEISIDSLEVNGLNSFKLFDILEPIAPQTLENNIAMDNMTVVFGFSVNSTNTSDPAQSYRVSFDVKDINATVYLFAAVDMDKIGSLTIGSLLFMENILPCLLASAYDIHVPAMRVNIGNISEPKIEGLMADTNEAAAASLKAIFKKYEALFINATNSIFDSSIRVVVNDFITSYIEDSPQCQEPDALVDSTYVNTNGTSPDLIDFRDLLLPPESAVLFGGSGLEPYGNVVSMAYDILLNQLSADTDGELLGINTNIESFTESQSGVKGMVRMQDELFGTVLNDTLPIDFLDFLRERIELSVFDLRMRNIDTIVSPAAIAYPTKYPYVIENMINFGPVVGKALNATVGALLSLEGDLTSLNMYNKFDLSGALSEIDMVAAISVFVRKEYLFRFPLRDVLEINCWLSLLEAPDDAGSTGAFKVESMLTKLSSLSMSLGCLNCTSRVIADAIKIVDGAGASRTFGDRLGFLIEDIAKSDVVTTLLKDIVDLGDDAARLCPHHPLFNTSSSDVDVTKDTSLIPTLSTLSIDTVLFAAAVFAQVSVIVGADNHLQNPGEATDPLAGQKALGVPQDAKLIDWTKLDEIGIPLVGEVLDFVRGFLGEPRETETGGQDIGVNVFIADYLDDDGVFEAPLDGFAFEQSGVRLQINSVRAIGLDSFTQFDILYPYVGQTMQNNISLDSLTLQLDISVDFEETSEPPNHLNMTFDLKYINATVPLFAAVDEYLLGNLTIGQLLHLSNIFPCVLSSTYGLQLEQMIISVQNISEPVFEGLLPDTSEALANASYALYLEFGEMVKASIPYFFEDTLRVLINGYLASFGESDCKTPPTNTSSRYVDFREFFRPSNSTGYSPYGDIMPMAKELLQEMLFARNPETNMPKINDELIAPLTEEQSGVAGDLEFPAKLFGFETEALASVGIDILGVEFSNGKIQNLDTFGEPLEVLKPNHTRGDLLDNRATFGTQLRPLRFSIRGAVSFFGPFIDTRDVLDIFGEVRSAPIFAVILARIGAQEFLNFPIGHTSSPDCWFAAFAEPALDAIEAGDLTVNPLLSMHYLEIAFEAMRLSASCYNCSTRGLDVVPELLEILETTTTKNVLGYRNVELLVQLINSQFAQSWMLRFFQDSIRKCEYTSNATSVSITWDDPDFPKLSEYDMETGIFTVTVLLQLGLVIMAETISDVVGIQPLISDPDPEIPPGTRLVDFTALDTYSNGALVKMMIDVINGLGEETEDMLSGEKTLGINSILGNPIAPIDQFVFDEEIEIGISTLSLNIKSVTISGFDSFTTFQVANITGPTTLRHQLGWERLQLDLSLEVEFGDYSEDDDSELRRTLREENIDGDGKYPFDLTIELVDVLLDAETFVALDYELLKYVELGNFLRFAYILPCIQASILHLELTDAVFEIGRVTKMQVSGFESEDTIFAAENLEEVLIEKYGETIASMAPNVFSAAMRPLMNTQITSYLRGSEFKCDDFPFDPSTGGFVDFRDLLLDPPEAIEYGGSGRGQYGDLFSTVFSYSNLFVNFFLLPRFDEGFSLPGPIIDQGIKMNVTGFESAIVLRVSDLEIRNVNNIKSLEYTEPIIGEPFVLNNSAMFGVGRQPLEIKFRVYFVFKGLNEDLAEADFSNDFDVTIDIKSLGLVLTSLLKVREESFVRFPLRDMLRLNCWLATIPPPELDAKGFRVPGAEPTLSVKELLVSMQELNMDISCRNCSSPLLQEWGELLREPGTSDELTSVANDVVQAIVDSLAGDLLQDQLDKLLVEAPMRCPHTDNFDPFAPPFQFGRIPVQPTVSATFTTYVILIIVLLAVALIIILGVRVIVTKRHKKWLVTLPSEKVFLIQQKQEKEDHMESELNELTLSMYDSPDVPRMAQYIIPFIVVINVGFFLSGHLNNAANLVINVSLFGESFSIDEFQSFSIAQSVLDMWYVGGEAGAILILLFSGIWPYTKQLITLALWFLPPSVVSVSRRGQFLMWLDILAKWSIVDIFVTVILVISFRMGITSPEFVFLPDKFVDVQIVVIPMWGLWANLFAQLMSQVSSHFIVMYHRRIIRHGKVKYMERHHPLRKIGLASEQVEPNELLSSSLLETETRDQLCKYGFTRPHKEDGPKLVPRRTTNFLLPFCSVLLGVLLIFCCMLPTFYLEIFGLFGLGMELGKQFAETSARSVTIFSICQQIIEQAIYLDTVKQYIGHGILVVLFIGTLVLVPLLVLATLAYMWLFPQTRGRREKVAVTLEILQAWQYVEVYLLAVVLSAWQISDVSLNLLNPYCVGLDPLLRQMAAYGLFEKEDAQCFQLVQSIGSGAYLLIPFVMGLAVVGSYVLKAYVQYLREKHDEEDDMPEEDKLRAFDRTTWDNRENAIENIRPPHVLFTDTFRWTLRSDASGTGVVAGLSDQQSAAEDPMKLDNVATYPVADTSSSEDENADMASQEGDVDMASKDEDVAKASKDEDATKASKDEDIDMASKDEDVADKASKDEE